ncbi:IS66 family transposase [Streptococcus halichoeri]|uniref:IS66 family transposase n=1 Tax=Streptococcus halichoeri TaxID=254785 RepID=UPI002F3F397D
MAWVQPLSSLTPSTRRLNLRCPINAQKEDWHKLGLPISRKEITNWPIKSSQYYFEPIYDLLHEKLLEHPIFHADESSYRGFESDSQLTYLLGNLPNKETLAKKEVLEADLPWTENIESNCK